MEKTGEQFVPSQSTPFEIWVNLERYCRALQHCAGKTVLDLGCGAGLGTYLYSLVAKKVYAIDYNDAALSYASHFPFPHSRVEFLKLDMTKPEDIAALPEHDICIALEFLEHLENPAAVLKALKGKELFFSVPLHSLSVSTWHRFPISTVEDVVRLVGPFYDVGAYGQQDHPPHASGKWIWGHGVRYDTNR